MEGKAQVKAVLDREQKCQFFAALAVRDTKFTQWLQHQIAYQLTQWTQSQTPSDSPGKENMARLIRHFKSGHASEAAWHEMANCILGHQSEWGQDVIPAIMHETTLFYDDIDGRLELF